MEEHKAILEDLFTQGFKDFPFANPQKVEDSQPYALGVSAAAKLAEIEEQRAFILARAKELSGGSIGRVGFV